MNDPATLNSMLEARLFYCQGIRLLSESIHSDERRVTLTTLLFALLLPRDLLQRESGFPIHSGRKDFSLDVPSHMPRTMMRAQQMLVGKIYRASAAGIRKKTEAR